MMRAEIVLIILAMGLVTYATRVGAFAVLRLTGMPTWLRRSVKYVPVGVLTALIVPPLAVREGALLLSLENHYLLAGLITALVAWKTRNVAITVGVGLAVVMTLTALF